MPRARKPKLPTEEQPPAIQQPAAVTPPPAIQQPAAVTTRTNRSPAMSQPSKQLFNVVRVEKKDNDPKNYYREVGTLMVRDDERSGVLWLNMLAGDFPFFIKTPEEGRGSSSNFKGIIFNVTRPEKFQKPGQQEGTKYNEIGTFILRESRENGALKLNLFEEEYAVFRREKKTDENQQ
ncbi:hypothetical protein [Corallococcus sp. AB038B]|uniref:hypothetical protein n=1 Tax=Corallococcus sp. AB038B TaxID=2316718 RepID=UPI000EBC3E7C|nr:hypothetical protein [Corallococcus sp. AB038B]RKH92790.1 hypothetical protein D7Y04_42360 [Corallococcus sp. AB038B]